MVQSEATTFDVGALASNPAIYENYGRFRREHLRLTVPDIAGVIGVAILIPLATAAIVLSV